MPPEAISNFLGNTQLLVGWESHKRNLANFRVELGGGSCGTRFSLKRLKKQKMYKKGSNGESPLFASGGYFELFSQHSASGRLGKSRERSAGKFQRLVEQILQPHEVFFFVLLFR